MNADFKKSVEGTPKRIYSKIVKYLYLQQKKATKGSYCLSGVEALQLNQIYIYPKN